MRVSFFQRRAPVCVRVRSKDAAHLLSASNPSHAPPSLLLFPLTANRDLFLAPSFSLTLSPFLLCCSFLSLSSRLPLASALLKNLVFFAPACLFAFFLSSSLLVCATPTLAISLSLSLSLFFPSYSTSPRFPPRRTLFARVYITREYLSFQLSLSLSLFLFLSFIFLRPTRPFFFGFFFSGGARDFQPPPTTTPKFISERRHNRGPPPREPAQETIGGPVFRADTRRKRFRRGIVDFRGFFLFASVLVYGGTGILEIQCFT